MSNIETNRIVKHCKIIYDFLKNQCVIKAFGIWKKMQAICFPKEANPLKQALNIVGHFANSYLSVDPFLC